MIWTTLLAMLWMGIVTLILRICAGIFEKKCLEEVSVSLGFSADEAREGESLMLYETVENRKKDILPLLALRFKTSRYLSFPDVEGVVSDYFYRKDLLSVKGYEKVVRKLTFRCKKRGVYTIEDVEITASDSFFFTKKRKKIAAGAGLTVYPKRVDLSRLNPEWKRQYGSFSSPLPLFEDPFSYIGIRDYMPGDDMKKIHWKSSAKSGHLQVKTSDYKGNENVLVLCHLESPGTFINSGAMEENIRITFSLVEFLRKNDVNCHLIVNGNESHRFHSMEPNFFPMVKRFLAQVEYDRVRQKAGEFMATADERIQGDECIYLISSVGKKEVTDYVGKWLKKGIPVTWIATIGSGEDDTAGCSGKIREHLVRWPC